ncbi:hypothetical protein QR680_006505 [Steinernema hermaphroditum]|uniref:Autophagy-related protein n=1 Tax=Steinernema hermaphroditum TaxID=289476 RepID=A0AA39LXJ1_9BILA|nr:hypothetical protein QR680_006505 [Steinernema hermaphroditum]
MSSESVPVDPVEPVTNEVSVAPAEDTRPFKERFTLERRQRMAAKMLQDRHDAVAVVCEKASHSKLARVDKVRYVMARSMTVAQLMAVIREKMQLRDDESLFFFVKNTIPPMTQAVGDLWDKYADEDGFLYFTYQEESVYGH